MHTKQQLNEMKTEHDQWQDRIRFYKDEISHFNNHLGRLSMIRHSQDMMASVEHFQNQFIRQKEILDIIRHEFKQHENLIEALESGKAVEPNDGIQRIHAVQRDKLDQFEHIFHDLRHDFNIFLNKVD